MDIEKAFLGACIQDGELLSSVYNLLEPSEFYLESHQKIFGVMLDLHELSEPIDLITVEHSLGGTHSAADLAGMAEGAVSSPSILRHYAGLIRAAARKREALKILKQAEYEIDSSVEEYDLIPRVIESLSGLQNGNGKRNGFEPVLIRVSDVEREEVDYVWDVRIPLKKLTLFEGDPGVGKSFCSLAVAAAITLGTGLPGQKQTSPGNVLILSCEDGIADTIRPRLEDMGADLKRISVLRGARDAKGQERAVTLADLDILERAMMIEKPILTVVDPLIAYLGSGIDEWKASSVRSVLGPLAALAEKTGSAVVGIRHLVKSATRASYKGAGSIDFLASCRSAFVFGENPDAAGEYVMAHVKASLGPKAPSLTYSIDHGRFAWGGESSLTAEQVIAVPSIGKEPGEKEEAERFLLDVLAAGPVASKDVQKQAREAGGWDRTLWRAKTALKIKASKDGLTGGWKWSLPS